MKRFPFALFLCLLLTAALAAASALEYRATALPPSDFTPVEPPAPVSVPAELPAHGEATEPSPVSFITLHLVGDVMLASMRGDSSWGSFNEFAARTDASYFFEKMAPLFRTDDFTVANCENVFTDRDLPSLVKEYSPAYWYRAPSSFADILREGGIEAVSIANNHIQDYGGEGRKDTIAALENAGVLWGDPTRTIRLEKDGFAIAILCTTITSGGYTTVWEPLEEAAAWADYRIVFFHGGVERSYEIDPTVRAVCRQMAEAGADMVVGHHPHVLQPTEVWQGVTICYSLGNFLFGGGLGAQETAVVEVTLTLSGGELLDVQEAFIPALCYTENQWQPAPAEGRQAEIISEFLAGGRDSPET